MVPLEGLSIFGTDSWSSTSPLSLIQEGQRRRYTRGLTRPSWRGGEEGLNLGVAVRYRVALFLGLVPAEMWLVLGFSGKSCWRSPWDLCSQQLALVTKPRTEPPDPNTRWCRCAGPFTPPHHIHSLKLTAQYTGKGVDFTVYK